MCSALDRMECFLGNGVNRKCGSVEEIIQSLPRISPGQNCEMNCMLHAAGGQLGRMVSRNFIAKGPANLQIIPRQASGLAHAKCQIRFMRTNTHLMIGLSGYMSDVRLLRAPAASRRRQHGLSPIGHPRQYRMSLLAFRQRTRSKRVWQACFICQTYR